MKIVGTLIVTTNQDSDDFELDFVAHSDENVQLNSKENRRRNESLCTLLNTVTKHTPLLVPLDV